jgi:hypothetical protein
MAEPHAVVTGIADNQVLLAWEAGRTSPLIRDFASIAAANLPDMSTRGQPDQGRIATS